MNPETAATFILRAGDAANRAAGIVIGCWAIAMWAPVRLANEVYPMVRWHVQQGPDKGSEASRHE